MGRDLEGMPYSESCEGVKEISCWFQSNKEKERRLSLSISFLRVAVRFCYFFLLHIVKHRHNNLLIGFAVFIDGSNYPALLFLFDGPNQ
jgi:hypothetical protein